MKIAFTVNGPGEYAGWLRPLLTALYRCTPDLEASIFCVPDDYATGREATLARTEFPQATVYDPKAYLAVALGVRRVGRLDRVQYLGGDLMHAARLHALLGGTATSYKFSRPRYAQRFARVFAVDAANRRSLVDWKTPEERISVVGNLAIDGAFAEAETPSAGGPREGIVIMPGSRKHEVAHLVPFFLSCARRIREIDASVRVSFGLSPFTSREELDRALAAGGHPLAFGERGRVVVGADGEAIESADGVDRFPIARRALYAASRARLAITIPGTKAIELAALGVPAVVALPFNIPEKAVINGPLQYLDRVPLVGRSLKAQMVLRFARRFAFYAQPNIDAGRLMFAEVSGTLTPGHVARVAYERYVDDAWLAVTSGDAGALYADHRGAAERMARELVA